MHVIISYYKPINKSIKYFEIKLKLKYFYHISLVLIKNQKQHCFKMDRLKKFIGIKKPANDNQNGDSHVTPDQDSMSITSSMLFPPIEEPVIPSAPEYKISLNGLAVYGHINYTILSDKIGVLKAKNTIENATVEISLGLGNTLEESLVYSDIVYTILSQFKGMQRMSDNFCYFIDFQNPKYMMKKTVRCQNQKIISDILSRENLDSLKDHVMRSVRGNSKVRYIQTIQDSHKLRDKYSEIYPYDISIMLNCSPIDMKDIVGDPHQFINLVPATKVIMDVIRIYYDL